MSDVFFILGVPRSGTTAFARILNTASNAEVYVEQPPKLRIASRDLLKGELPNPKEVVFDAKVGPIHSTLRKGKKYGDKNPCYMPFIPYLLTNWDCKVVFLIRNGRDVLKSIMNWHYYYLPSVFIMQEDDDSSTLVHPEQDPWDYSRIRPNSGEPFFDEWKHMSRFKKIAWYWSNFNVTALDLLSHVGSERWILVDVSSATVNTVNEIFYFLGLEDFDSKRIGEMLCGRINSLADKVDIEDVYPTWTDWTTQQRLEFEQLAGEMMGRLGYS